MGWDPYELLEPWLAATLYPSRTRENYQAHTGDWLDHCRESGLEWDKVVAQHIALWAHRPEAPHSATARFRGSFLLCVCGSQGCRCVQSRGPSSPPHESGPVDSVGLDPWQIAVLLAAFDERGHQDRACGYLQIGLGLRAGALLAVNLDDLSTERDIGRGADTLRLPYAGGGYRLVALPPLVSEAANAYLPRRRPPRDGRQGGPLFTNRTGIKMPHRYPHDLLRTVAAASGLLSTPL
ncbi:hypothetical protein [Streptomyces sp. NBC_00035]|uniref:hypothetical protein n=1 Tax=Streptomyces sp. NBC_00035 TaxID=2903614 RepID=UPI003252BCBC